MPGSRTQRATRSTSRNSANSGDGAPTADACKTVRAARPSQHNSSDVDARPTGDPTAAAAGLATDVSQLRRPGLRTRASAPREPRDLTPPLASHHATPQATSLASRRSDSSRPTTDGEPLSEPQTPGWGYFFPTVLQDTTEDFLRQASRNYRDGADSFAKAAAKEELTRKMAGLSISNIAKSPNTKHAGPSSRASTPPSSPAQTPANPGKGSALTHAQRELQATPAKVYPPNTVNINGEVTTYVTTNARANEIGSQLWDLNIGRFDVRPVTFLPDDSRDAALLQVRQSSPVTVGFDEVIGIVDGAKGSNATERATRLEIAWTKLCTTVRQRIRARMLGTWDSDPGLGTHTHQGAPVHNPLPDSVDTEENKPDIVVWQSRPPRQPSSSASWERLCGIWEIKAEAMYDAKQALTMQVMRYQRRILMARPIVGHFFAATLCGPLVRIYRFDPAGWSMSPPFDIRKRADDLDVMRIIGLFAASRQGELLQQWQPFPQFTVQKQASANAEEWVWKTEPEVLYVRGMITGNRTTIWRGTARPGASSEWAWQDLLLKASYVERHLRGHEAKILRILEGRGGAPVLVGEVVIDEAVAGGAQGGRANAPVLDAFAMHHAVGEPIALTMEERHLVDVFGQVPDAFSAFSAAEVHYRDPNNGNILCRWNKARTRPLLVVTDFGNARHGWRRRGASGASEYDLIEIGKEDARSANKLFEPCTVIDIERTAEDLATVDPEKHPAKYQALLREAVQYAHRYIDDLESVVHMQFWHGACRSSPSGTLTESAKSSFERSKKAGAWSRPVTWELLLDRECSAMSSEWRELMCEQREIIFTAQQEVRAHIAKVIKNLIITNAQDVLHVSRRLPREEQCFSDLKEAFKRYRDKMDAKT